MENGGSERVLEKAGFQREGVYAIINVMFTSADALQALCGFTTGLLTFGLGGLKMNVHM